MAGSEPKCRNKSPYWRFIITVEPVILLYVSATTMYNPLLQQYMYDEVSKHLNFTAADIHDICSENRQTNFTNSTQQLNIKSFREVDELSNTDQDLHGIENKVQAETSHRILYINLANMVPSVLSSSIYGPWSDKVGRKPVLIISLAGELMNAVVANGIITFGLPFYLLFISSFMSGLCGSYVTILVAALSYTADITDESNRSFRIGVVESMIYLGSMVGFLISGVWKDDSGGYTQPFWGVLGFHAVNLLYVMVILPKSKREAVVKVKTSKPISCDNYKNVVMLFREHTLLRFALISFFFTLFAWSVNDIMVLYVKASPLCWSSSTFGYFMCAQTTVIAAATVLTLKLLKPYVSDALLVASGVISTIVGYALKSIANTTAMMFWSILPFALGGLPNPVLRAIMSKLTASTKQGALFSVVGIVEIVSRVISPILFNTLYPVTRSKLHFPGFCFALTAGFAFVSLFFLIPLFGGSNKEYKVIPQKEKSEEYEPLTHSA